MVRSFSCLRNASSQLEILHSTILLSYTFSQVGDLEMKTKLFAYLASQAKISGPRLPGFNLDYTSCIVCWLLQQQNPYGGFSSTQKSQSQ
ncbi:hypothetical protein GN956_G8008 [Arapaima gigas]